MIVPLFNLRLQYAPLKQEINEIFDSFCKSASFVKGPMLEAFEKDFAKYVGTKYCIGVASGTDALYLSLHSLGITRDDEVIVPVNTFIATAYAVLYTGAKPVFVDIDERTYNIDSK